MAGARWFVLAVGLVCPGLGSDVSVPFVGCESTGQKRVLEAPKGTRKAVRIPAKDAAALAYYESGDGIGFLGPRGWYCQGVSGSGGAALHLSPHRIERDGQGLRGEVVGAYRISSAASGRLKVAEIILRVFPVYRETARRVLEEVEIPIPGGPFPWDKLTYRGKTAVEYETPANAEGLGNEGPVLGKNAYPIRGVAILVQEPNRGDDLPDMLLLAVRLGPERKGLVSSIVSEFARGK